MNDVEWKHVFHPDALLQDLHDSDDSDELHHRSLPMMLSKEVLPDQVHLHGNGHADGLVP